MRSVFGRHLLQFFAIDGIEKTVPKPSGDSEVHVRVLVMNEVVGPQFSIPSIFEVEVMMGVMNDAVENESSCRVLPHRWRPRHPRPSVRMRGGKVFAMHR